MNLDHSSTISFVRVLCGNLLQFNFVTCATIALSSRFKTEKDKTLYHLSRGSFKEDIHSERQNQLTDSITVIYTVQMFNSCTSSPDVCPCLVVQKPMDNMSKNKPSTSMTHLVRESKPCSVVRSSVLRKLGVRSCILPGLSTRLV